MNEHCDWHEDGKHRFIPELVCACSVRCLDKPSRSSTGVGPFDWIAVGNPFIHRSDGITIQVTGIEEMSLDDWKGCCERFKAILRGEE